MNKRENLLAMLAKKPFEEIPIEFGLSPGLVEVFREKTGFAGDYMDYFGMPWRPSFVPEPVVGDFKKYYLQDLKPGTVFDMWGVAHEPGSAAALHMTRMHHPLKDADSVAVLDEYPFPCFNKVDVKKIRESVLNLHKQELASVGYLHMTIWETAWAIRSMEELFADMMEESPMAEKLLDTITDIAVKRAELYVSAGVDILYLGDDIGMQHTPMMSVDMYVTWLKPRLSKVISAARAINPSVIIFYHSCGMMLPFIPHLIEAGIDVLHPVQPECLDFEQIYKEYKSKLSFQGTLGTQTTFPMGTPAEMKETVYRNLDISDGGKGLFISPTHLLEPDVPWENIVAYVDACKEYGRFV
ncbi:MAG: uroporphyrinogen decarboxylase family protein [Defluviitaleaceae bacterium]|nr:uroporphyrinogen decarboxylase family protein [Defluviitaleaceae bacterium]